MKWKSLERTNGKSKNSGAKYSKPPFWHQETLQSWPFLIINRPGVAEAVLQTALSLTDWLIHSVMICENIFTAPPCPNGCKWCLQSWNRLNYNIFGDFKSWRTSQSHYWFKSYSNFADQSEFFLLDKVVKLVDGGSVINKAYPV